MIQYYNLSGLEQANALTNFLYTFGALVILAVGGVGGIIGILLRKSTKSGTEAKAIINRFETQVVPEVKEEVKAVKQQVEQVVKDKIEANQKVVAAQVETVMEAHKNLAESSKRQESILTKISETLNDVKSNLSEGKLKFEMNDKEHTDIKKKIDENHSFHERWQQRIEDDIDEIKNAKSSVSHSRSRQNKR